MRIAHEHLAAAEAYKLLRPVRRSLKVSSFISGDPSQFESQLQHFRVFAAALTPPAACDDGSGSHAEWLINSYPGHAFHD
jgi:hypothetical protein